MLQKRHRHPRAPLPPDSRNTGHSRSETVRSSGGGHDVAEKTQQYRAAGAFVGRHLACHGAAGAFVVRHSTRNRAAGAFVGRHSACHGAAGAFVHRHLACHGAAGTFVGRHLACHGAAGAFVGRHLVWRRLVSWRRVDSPCSREMCRHGASSARGSGEARLDIGSTAPDGVVRLHPLSGREEPRTRHALRSGQLQLGKPI